MEMHEYLSVNKPLSNETVIERIRSYYLTLMEELCDGESLNREFDVKLSVDGKLFSVVNNIAEIQRGMNALSGKEAFFIDVRTIGFDMAGDKILPISICPSMKNMKNFMAGTLRTDSQEIFWIGQLERMY